MLDILDISTAYLYVISAPRCVASTTAKLLAPGGALRRAPPPAASQPLVLARPEHAPAAVLYRTVQYCNAPAALHTGKLGGP